jgi:hypothetical protein
MLKADKKEQELLVKKEKGISQAFSEQISNERQKCQLLFQEV